MTKLDWQNVYQKLDSILEDFMLEFDVYKSGKNKSIRANAERKIIIQINRADYIITNNSEIYNLITGGENVSDYGRSIIYEEFTRPNYFSKDLSRLLKLIEIEIKSIKD